MPDGTIYAAEMWSVERPFDFGDILNREPPTYADDEDDEPEPASDE